MGGPITYDLEDTMSYYAQICQECGLVINTKKSIMVDENAHPDFCPNCGQKSWWEDFVEEFSICIHCRGTRETCTCGDFTNYLP